MSDNNNNAKTMYEAVPAAAELNKVPDGTPQRAYASDGHEDHRADGDFRGQGISGPQ